MSEGENEGAYARLRRCVKLLRRLQTLDFDGIVAVTGEKGIGKSTVGLQILRQLHGDYFPERPFRIAEVVAYSNEDVREKLATLPKFGGFMADEAARFAMGEDWMKSDNKELKKLLAQCRKPNNLIGLLNIPQLTWLDNKYISGLVNVWLWVVARGVAVILMPDINPGQTDPWHLKWMEKKLKSIHLFDNTERTLERIQRHPCYVDYFAFPKLPQDIYDRYLELRNERTQGEMHKSYRTQKQLAFLAGLNMYYRWPELTAAVERSKQGRPTWRIMEDELFRDPETGKGAIAFSSLRSQVQPLARKHGMQLQAEQDKEEEMPELKV